MMVPTPSLTWLPSYLACAPKRRSLRSGEPVHLLLCVADHYEPKLGGASPDVARARVETWVREYPRLFGEFRDSDGKPPRHSFFVPQDEYEPEHVDGVTELCRAGYGEVEIHLHHDGDCSDGLRRRLLEFKQILAERHGQLSRHKDTGELGYAFIHGNWALDNSRPDGRWCGVNNELDVLRETGCFVDMTLPAYPNAAQTRTINSIYYATDDPARPKSHDTGRDVGCGPQPPRSLMLIQGPLLFDWGRRKWGLLPRVENACIQGNQAPSLARLWLWLKARVQVPSRPDWFFVKLHTHGANEANQCVLLGDAMVNFHRGLAEYAADNAHFHYHYVTAREMYNLAKAAEAGWQGGVDKARDFVFVPNARPAPGHSAPAARERCLTAR